MVADGSERKTKAPARRSDGSGKGSLYVALALGPFAVLLDWLVIDYAVDDYAAHGHQRLPTDIAIMGLLFSIVTCVELVLWWRARSGETRDGEPGDSKAK